MTFSTPPGHDRSVLGSDRTEQLWVTVDASNRRVTSVMLQSVPEVLRRPDGLAEAVEHAQRQVTLKLAARDRQPAPARTPLTARTRTTPPPRPSMDTDPDRRPDLEMLQTLEDVDGPRLRASGLSDNGCLRVVLLPASARGSVEVLAPGWLTQATGQQIGAALTQAFASAYEKRNER